MAERHRGDVLPTRHALIRHGKLLLCNAVVLGPDGARDVALLLDTESNYTVVGADLLEGIGCSPAASRDHVRITTANGIIILPRVVSHSLTVFERTITGAGCERR